MNLGVQENSKTSERCRSNPYIASTRNYMSIFTFLNVLSNQTAFIWVISVLFNMFKAKETSPISMDHDNRF